METKKVARYIADNHLLAINEKVIVALSGGADSVALLLMLQELGYACEAAHCNFHLRGSESDRDETFVRQLCQERQVKLHITHFDTKHYASQKHISIEMAARELRYEWFETLRNQLEATAIAVAHHADDSVETFLLNLLRGTGINGLRGIRPRNGYIIRPLLCLKRNDILHYLTIRSQSYVTDSTNLQDEYTRNKIRLHLLPLMAEINPSVKDSIMNTAHHLDEAACFYHHAIGEARQRVSTDNGKTIDIAALMREPSPEALLFELLSSTGVNATQLHDIYKSLNGQAGKVFDTPEWQIVKDRTHLLVEPRQKNTRSPQLQMEECELTPDFIIPRDKSTACFDADKLSQPFTIRLWQQGDSFVPFGMKGRKKVSDYLTDRKFSLAAKGRQWVLCAGNEIVWLIDERPDNRFRIGPETKRVLIIKSIKEETSE